MASFAIVVFGSAFLYLLPDAPRVSGSAGDSEGVAVEQRCDSLSDYKAGRECLKRRVRTQVEKEGAEAAFLELRSLYETDERARIDCHQLAHEIGHAGFDRYRDVAGAFTHGDPFCWSGYYHGVLESYVADIGYENLPGRMNTICESMPGREKYSFDYYNCVHGIGHGVMAVTGDDLTSSLGLCDGLSGRWEQQSCYGGVFMQNTINEHFGEHRADFKEDDAAYPCTAVDQRYKDSCYITQTSHMLKAFRGNFTEVFAACAAIPDKEFLDTCYQSIGRDASGSSVSDPVKTKATCMLGTDRQQRVGCVIGAAKDFVSYFHSDVEAKAFCDSLDDEYLEKFCIAAVEQLYVAFQ